ncbi:MAG: energy transducer TonB [Tepidimonas sp.]|nr:energy transducer TonB [Tepidimonas sp.]MDW8335957.1 energy transducer TonB [Tepidimonas sp.]
MQRPAPVEPSPVPPVPQPTVAPAAVDPHPAVSEAPASTPSGLVANEASPHTDAAPSASARPSAPPAPPRIELPSANAAYLNNPPPAYPAISRRLGEQGRVVLRVRIEPDGTASAAEIRSSSGYERLDRAALDAVLRWRYVPGKRNGVPEAMWFLIPIQFVLE